MIWWLAAIVVLIIGDLLIVTPALGFYGRDLFCFQTENRHFRLRHLFKISKGFIKRYAEYLHDCYDDPWIYKRDFKQQWFLLFSLRGLYVMTKIGRMRFSIIGLLILKWRYQFFAKSFSEKEQELFGRAEEMEREFRRQ